MGDSIYYLREYQKIEKINIEEKFKNYFKNGDFSIFFSYDFKEEKWNPRHYVGILPFDNDILIIGPKRKDGNKSPNEIEKDLLKFSYLSYFSGYPESFSKVEVAEKPKWKLKDLSDEKLGIYFLTILYGISLERLCKNDFRRAYLLNEEVLKGRIKGKLNKREYLKNYFYGKRNFFPCLWEDFTEDNIENRILKYALKKLENLKSDKGWHNEILRENFKIPKWKFASVEDFENFGPSFFNKTRLDKISKYYKETFYIAKQIIFGSESIKKEEGISPILFDTNALFEKVVIKICEIAGRDKGYDIFNFDKKNDNNKIFKDKDTSFNPDVVLKKGEEFVLIDAKYKLVVEAEKNNLNEIEEMLFSPDTKDLYQIYFYMRNLKARKGIFFVPIWEEAKGNIEKEFMVSPLNSDEHKLYAIPINLAKDDLKNELNKKINNLKNILNF